MAVKTVTGFPSSSPQATSLRARLRALETAKAGKSDPLIKSKHKISRDLYRLKRSREGFVEIIE